MRRSPRSPSLRRRSCRLRERFYETTAHGPGLPRGDASGVAVRRARPLLQELWDGPVAYPVAVAAACAGHAIALEPALHAF